MVLTTLANMTTRPVRVDARIFGGHRRLCTQEGVHSLVSLVAWMHRAGPEGTASWCEANPKMARAA